MDLTHRINLVVLRDIDDLRAEIERELAAAAPAEAPGLRRTLALIDSRSVSDSELKSRWARRYLEEAGVPAGDTSAAAIKKLRKAVPGLGLAEAVALVTTAAEK